MLFLKADGKDKVSVVVCKFFYSFLFTLVSQSFYFINYESLQSAVVITKQEISLIRLPNKKIFY